MFKKTLIALVVCLALSVSIAHAGLNENSQQQGQVGINEQQQGQIGINEQQQGQIGINKNKNTNEQGQAQIGINEQDQDQGQLQGQGQFAVGQVQVQDNSSYEAYSFSPPGLNPTKGMNEGNIYSIFGGIGLSEDAEYAVCIEKLAVIERMAAAGYLSDEDAQEEALAAFEQLKEATQTKRILGVGPKTRGRHIFNMFGLIATDSYRGNNNAEEVEEVIEEDQEITGNEGYVN